MPSPVETQSRVYAMRALERGSSYYGYETYKLVYGDIDNYSVQELVGRGKYSTVFRGKTKEKKTCIIKVLKPIKEKKICREAKILHTLKGIPSIVQILDIVRDKVTGTKSFIFAYQRHTETRSLFPQFTLDDIRYYMRVLLEALDTIHSMGIMHRDIKPHNLIIDGETREIKIIDWGLAEYYLPNTYYSVGVASLHFKAPELLVGQKYYDYSLDIWSLGCVLSEIIFNQVPMFNGRTNEDQLLKIVKVLGTDDLHKYIKSQNLHLSSNLLPHIKILPPHRNLPSIKPDLYIEKKDKDNLLQLINGMLIYNHQERLTARECLNLPFFKNK